MKARDCSDGHIHDCISKLDKLKPVARSPADASKLPAGCRRGRKHLGCGLANLLNCALDLGYPEEWVSRLKRAIKWVKSSANLDVLGEEAIIDMLRAEIPLKYKVIHHIVLDPRIRPMHALRLLNN